MRRLRIELYGICIGVAHRVSRELDDGKLHAQAETQVGNPMGPGIIDGADHTRNAPVTEAAGHQYTVHVGKYLFYIILINSLGVHPLDVDPGPVLDAAVL